MAPNKFKQKGNKKGDKNSTQNKSAKPQPQPQSQDSELKREVLALGGDEDDLKLFEGVDSDDEQAFNKSEQKDPALMKDLKELYKSLDFNSAQPQADEEEEEEAQKGDDKDSDIEEADNNGSETDEKAASASEDDEQEDSEEEASEEGDEESNQGEDVDPLSEIDPNGPFAQIPQWFLQPLPQLTKSKANVGKSLATDGQIARSQKLLEELPKTVSSSSAVSASDKKFLDQMLKSGTLNDRVSALALLIAESPIHNISSLESLKSMAAKPKREEALRAMKALIDWLAGPHGLPSNRKLAYIADQPNLTHQGATDKHLTFWAFENWFKGYFFEVLQLLEVG